MALRSQLSATEIQCKSVEDFVNLAWQALAEPYDFEYALYLADKASGICRLPAEYIGTAEIYARCDSKAKADELYTEAEDNCFEAMEFAELGHSIAKYFGNRERAAGHISSAAKDATKIADILLIARYAAEDINDEDLAASLLSKIEKQCKTADDLYKAAESIIQSCNDVKTARELYRKAGSQLSGSESAVKYVDGIIRLFNDKEWAAEELETAVDDAKFTKDFILIAEAYKKLLSDEDKSGELMEQASDYAMTGEDFILLADSWLKIFGNKEESAKAYDKALKNITDKNILVKLAEDIALSTGDKELSLKFFHHAEGRITSPAELSSMAAKVLNTTGDNEYATNLYEKAISNSDNPKELISIAGGLAAMPGYESKALSAYEAALEKADNYSILMELINESSAKLRKEDFIAKVIDKAVTYVSASPEMAALGIKAAENGNITLARQLLADAEESVTNTKEMKEVKEAVNKYFDDDDEWDGRLEEKIKKREANQAKYDEFGKLENSAGSPKEMLSLACRAMYEIEDRYYARKLLKKAEDMLEAQAFGFGGYRKLVLIIQEHLDDKEWIEKILDHIFENRIVFFFDLGNLCSLLTHEIKDKLYGIRLAGKYLDKAVEKLKDMPEKSVYDYIKLSGAYCSYLNDRNKAVQLLDFAMQDAADYRHLVPLAALASKIGEVSIARQLINRTSDLCRIYPEKEILAEYFKAKGLGT